MVKREKNLILCFAVFFLLLVTPSIIAENTEVRIKTAQFSEVQMVIYDADIEEFTLTERYNGNSDEYGDIIKTFDISDEAFHLKVFVKKDGKTLISNKKFLDNPAGEFLYLEIASDDFVLVPTPGFENGTKIEEVVEVEINDTVNETEEVIESVEEESSQNVATGNSIFGEGGIFSKKTIYFAGGFFLLVFVIGFIVMSVKKKLRTATKEINVKKLSDLQRERKEGLEDKKEDITDYKKIIGDAERKISEAQVDIKKIKNEEKIKEVRKKIEEDERELRKLREGRD